MTRRVLPVAALVASVAACSRGPERRTAATGTAVAGAPSQWEIVYDHDVKGNVDLYVVPAGGGPERRLTDDPGQDDLARWTPDGKRIVFTSNRTRNPQLWEVSAEGGPAHRLRSNAATEYESDPSPDGKQLAFLSNLGGPERLMVEDLRTAAVRELVRHGNDPIMGNPHWSPDGRFITFSSNWRMGHQIYVVEVATGSYRRISGVTTGGCEPRFSRDGTNVVYVSRGHLRPTSRLVEHDLATGQERALVSWPALNYDPVYSPDGTELAFASNITGEYAIYRQRLSDGQAWRVTFGHGDARNPDYRPVR